MNQPTHVEVIMYFVLSGLMSTVDRKINSMVYTVNFLFYRPLLVATDPS